MRHYLENHANVAEYVRKLLTDFGRRKTPSAPYVHYLVKKVEGTGMTPYKVPLVQEPRNIRSFLEYEK